MAQMNETLTATEVLLKTADFDLTVVVCEQDLVETYGRIFLAWKTVDIKFPTFLSLKLLTCNLYYNVH